MPTRSSRTTTDHEQIRKWAEARGAKPACVKGTGGRGDPGMIRLDLPGYSGADSLKEISWDAWFDAFDRNGLALVYQERTADGARSNFNKLVAREGTEWHDRAGARSASGRSSSRASNRASSSAPGTASRLSLKEREYRDSDGQVHHHTRKYMEEHRGSAREASPRESQSHRGSSRSGSPRSNSSRSSSSRNGSSRGRGR
jgi:hypothetical protein